jgi:vacuolar-type H+-ATPase subunit I/STV1
MSDETTTPLPASHDEPNSRVEDRIRSLTSERRQLREQLATLQSQFEAQAEAVKAAEAMKAQLGEWETKYTTAESTWKTERELLARGINDAEGIEFVRLAYDRLPKTDRPALGDWLSDTEKLPKAVRAYLPDAPAASTQPAPPPRANAGAVPTGGQAPSNFSPQAIQSMSLEDYRTLRTSLGILPSSRR